MRAPDYEPYDPARDEPELERVVTLSFGLPPGGAAAYLAAVGAPSLRVVRRGGRTLGGLALLAMGQWLGGRRVPMTGVAAVAVCPSARGGGVATALVRAAVREMAASGVPLSVLYPAVLPLYRRAGYELAGTRYRTSAPCELLAAVAAPADLDALELRALDAADDDALVALHRALGARAHGQVDRHPSLWWRIARTLAGEELARWGVLADGELEGWCVLRQESGGRRRYDLALTDLGFATERAGRALLRFLGAHRSLAGEARWPARAADPTLALLPETGFRHELELPWMVRVLDPARALAARGYPAGLAARLELALTDPLCPEGSGRLVVTVEGGRAAVERRDAAPRTASPDDALALDVAALAPLLTGFLDPFALARAGRLHGPVAALERAQAVFAGPPPSMLDMF